MVTPINTEEEALLVVGALTGLVQSTPALILQLTGPDAKTVAYARKKYKKMFGIYVWYRLNEMDVPGIRDYLQCALGEKCTADQSNAHCIEIVVNAWQLLAEKEAIRQKAGQFFFSKDIKNCLYLLSSVFTGDTWGRNMIQMVKASAPEQSHFQESEFAKRILRLVTDVDIFLRKNEEKGLNFDPATGKPYSSLAATSICVNLVADELLFPILLILGAATGVGAAAAAAAAASAAFKVGAKFWIKWNAPTSIEEVIDRL